MFGPVPVPVHPFVGTDGKPSKEFYNFLKRLSEDSIALAAQVATLQTVITNMTTPVLFASLPSASPAGQRRFISDAGPPTTFDAAASGGGGGTPPMMPVYSDGTIWRYG